MPKISELPAATAASSTDQLEINQAGTSRRVTVDQLLDVTGGAYLPLAGGTLTGALTGTTATFSGNVTAGGGIANGFAYSGWTYATQNLSAALPTHSQGLAMGWNYAAGTGTVDFVNGYTTGFGHKFWMFNAGHTALLPAPVEMGALTGTTATLSGALTGTAGTFAGAEDAHVLRVGGAVYGARLYPSASGFKIEGTDETFSASWEPLILGGSALALQVAGTTKASVGGSDIQLSVPLTGTTAAFTTSVNYLGAASGTNTYAVTPTPALTAYATGYSCFVLFTNANSTTTPTLNISGLGAKTIVKRHNTAVASADIAAGMMCQFVYNGTNMVLLNPVVS